MTTTHTPHPRGAAYVQAALTTIRAAFRHGASRHIHLEADSASDPDTLRAVADTLELPYVLVSQAAHGGRRSQNAPITDEDLDAIRAWWDCPPASSSAPANADPAVNEALNKIEAVRDALVAMLDQNIHFGSDDETRLVALDLGIPPLVVGIVVEQWFSEPRFTMRDVNEGLAWLSRVGVDPRILEADDEDEEEPLFETK